MKLQDLTNQELAHVSGFIANVLEFTLECEDGTYWLQDHPDTSEDTYVVKTVSDLIEFAYVQGFAKGEKRNQNEIKKVLGL
jgi:hypothetical protein